MVAKLPDYFIIIAISIVVFNILGLFGNINLIVLHYRKPALRTNYGFLLVLLTSVESCSLLFENVNLAYGIYSVSTNTPIYRDDCFHLIFLYVFFIGFQIGLLTSIAVDLLICIIFPITYRKLNRQIYFFFLLLGPFLHGFYGLFFGFLFTDHKEIRLCNPPSSLNPSVNETNYILNLTVCTITVVAYTTAFSTIYFKNRRHSRVDIEKKSLKSISVIAIVFIVTRYGAMVFINILQFFDAPRNFIIAVQDFLVIFALIESSQNCYVCYFRSSEYRSMLNEQLGLLKKKLKASDDSTNMQNSTNADGDQKIMRNRLTSLKI